MRRLLFIFFALIFLITSQTFAADAFYRMLHAEEVESFRQDQDALIVGRLSGTDGGFFEVEVLRVISGEVVGDSILVEGGFSYYWSDAYSREPKVGDFCVFSLKRIGNFYKNAWGTFKADSGDYKSLRLFSNASASDTTSELACIEWYVNSDGKENDFYFSEDGAYVRRPDGQEIKIYPKPAYAGRPLTQLFQQKNYFKSLTRIIVAGFLVFIGAASIIFLRRKRKSIETGA